MQVAACGLLRPVARAAMGPGIALVAERGVIQPPAHGPIEVAIRRRFNNRPFVEPVASERKHARGFGAGNEGHRYGPTLLRFLRSIKPKYCAQLARAFFRHPVGQPPRAESAQKSP